MGAVEKGYPVLLNLEGRQCVIVGGGTVAMNKLIGLLDAGAYITIISPQVSPALETLALEHAIITTHLMEYQPGMLAQLRPVLVFAATNNAYVNQQVAYEARSIGALVDTVDSTEVCDFTSMSVLRRGEITLAIATGGASPAVTKHLRQKLEKTIGEEYAVLVEWLGAARPQVREIIPTQPERQKLWTKILESPVLDYLRKGDRGSARALMDKLINEATEKYRRE